MANSLFMAIGGARPLISDKTIARLRRFIAEYQKKDLYTGSGYLPGEAYRIEDVIEVLLDLQGY